MRLRSGCLWGVPSSCICFTWVSEEISKGVASSYGFRVRFKHHFAVPEQSTEGFPTRFCEVGGLSIYRYVDICYIYIYVSMYIYIYSSIYLFIYSQFSGMCRIFRQLRENCSQFPKPRPGPAPDAPPKTNLCCAAGLGFRWVMGLGFRV